MVIFNHLPRKHLLRVLLHSSSWSRERPCERLLLTSPNLHPVHLCCCTHLENKTEDGPEHSPEGHLSAPSPFSGLHSEQGLREMGSRSTQFLPTAEVLAPQRVLWNPQARLPEGSPEFVPRLLVMVLPFPCLPQTLPCVCTLTWASQKWRKTGQRRSHSDASKFNVYLERWEVSSVYVQSSP